MNDMLSTYRILQGLKKKKNEEGSQSSTQIILQSGSQGRFGFVPDQAYDNSD